MKYVMRVVPALGSEARNGIEAVLENKGYRIEGSELDCSGEYCEIRFVDEEIVMEVSRVGEETLLAL